MFPNNEQLSLSFKAVNIERINTASCDMRHGVNQCLLVDDLAYIYVAKT